MPFDTESKSILIKELAVKSPEGLRAALDMYERLVAAQPSDKGGNPAPNTSNCERLNAVAYASLLRGIHMHGMNKQSPQ